jgi:hypothetical protein
MKAIDSRHRVVLLASVILATLLASILLVMGQGSKASATDTTLVCQNDNSKCVRHNTTYWKQVTTTKALGGTYRVSSSKTAGAFFAAGAGTHIDFVTATGPNMGKAKVVVVNLANATVVKTLVFDLKTATRQYRVVKTIGGLLPDRPYGLIVTSYNGLPVVVDAFKYRAAPTVLPPHVVAEPAPEPPPAGTSG